MMVQELADNLELLNVRNVVAQLAQRSRRLVYLRAIVLFATFLLAGTALLATVDFLLQLRSGVLAWLPFGLFLLLLIAAISKLIVPAERYRPELVTVARRLEMSFPQLNQRLSTVCDLYQRIDRLSGTQRQFLNSLAGQVNKELVRLDLEQCFQPRVLLRPALGLAGVLLMVLSVLVVSPQQVATATQRVVMPWSGQRWPRDFELRLIDYRSQAAEGGDYLIEVVNLNGELPSDLTLELQWESAETSELIRFSTASGKAEYRFNNLLESFQFRLHGGDFHDVGWNKVTVVEAPSIRHSELVINPPEYTQLQPYTIDNRGRAFAKSQFEFSAALDNPIKNAQLIWDSQGKHTMHPLIIESNGDSYVVRIQGVELKTSGLFWLEFKDVNGVVAQTRETWEITVLEDEAPKIQVSKPSANTLLTATGILPVAIHTMDDLYVEELDVVIQDRNAGGAAKLQIPLNIPEVLVGSRTVYDANRVFVKQEPDSLQIECGLDVSLLAGFSVGQELTLSIVATDRFGNQAMSEAIRLSVLSDRELRGKLTQQLEDVQTQFRQLQRLLKESVETLAALKDETVLDHELRKLVQQLSLEGTNIQEVLVGENDSISVRLERIESTLRLAQIKAPLESDSLNRLQSLASAIRKEYLQPIRAGVFAVKQDLDPRRETWLSSLEAIEGSLLSAASFIDAVLGEQKTVQTKVEFEAAWKNLLAEQSDLNVRSSAITQILLINKENSEALLQDVSELQLLLGASVFQLVDQTVSAEELTLNRRVRELAAVVVSEMRQVAVDLRQNQLATVSQQQQQIIHLMQQVLIELGIDPESNRRASDRQAHKLVERLKDLYRQQVTVVAANTKPSSASLQLQLAKATEELSMQNHVSTLLQIGLQDVALLQFEAAEQFTSEKALVQQLQEDILELLEAMIGVAATELSANQDEKGTDTKLAISNSQTLALMKIMQQRLHVELNPLLQRAELTALEQQQLNLLIQKQERLVEAMKRIQMTKEVLINE